MELVPTIALTQLPFREAATAWLETRRSYLCPSTFRDYVIYIRTLNKYFSEMHLQEISADQIRAYQRARMSNAIWSSINKETSVLQQMMIRRYFHGRLSAQRSAVVAALSRKPPRAVVEMLARKDTAS